MEQWFGEQNKVEILGRGEEMNKGEKIEYAIFKEVSRFSFREWIEVWKNALDEGGEEE